MTDLIHTFAPVIDEFCHNTGVISIKRFGSGHINDSFLVRTHSETTPDFVLQRINRQVFKNIPELTSNILKVTHHLKSRLKSLPEKFDNIEVLQLVPAKDGNFFHRDQAGNFWRMYQYIEGSRSYDIVENTQLAYEGGKAFGCFHYLTSDLDPTGFYEVLPDFHNIVTRLATFRETVGRDPSGRVDDVKKEIDFVKKRAPDMHRIMELGKQGKVPVRVTHNDTKFNNILFNDKNKAICIIDLDTIMPGYILYDFGDAIRTGASTGAEDEKDLSKVNINPDLFESYSRGYLEIAGNFLNQEEFNNLAFSTRYMTFLIGLRFLTDHIDGDKYYKIHFPGHNLQRARAQFKLVSSIEENLSLMEKIIENLKNKHSVI